MGSDPLAAKSANYANCNRAELAAEVADIAVDDIGKCSCFNAEVTALKYNYKEYIMKKGVHMQQEKS